MFCQSDDYEMASSRQFQCTFPYETAMKSLLKSENVSYLLAVGIPVMTHVNILFFLFYIFLTSLLKFFLFLFKDSFYFT